MSSIDVISQHLGPALLVVFRISGLAVFGPVIGSPVIPIRVKALLVVALGLAVYPALAQGPLMGQHVDFSIGALAPLVIGEVCIGSVIGFLALLPMVAMQMGGLLMGQQMGLGFARIYNPAMGEEGDVLEQALFFLGLSTFICVGGLEQMTVAVTRSFQFVALGGFGTVLGGGGYGMENDIGRLLVGTLLAATELALRVSAPLIALFMLETVSMGFLSKSMPALNLMALGFPLRIILGLGVIVLGMAAIGEALNAFTHEDLALLSSWFESGGAA